MKKPNDFENAQIIGDYEVLEVGAYKCKILKAEECTASNEKEFLKISFDISEGDKKDFYKNKYTKDLRPDKKWSGVMPVFVLDYDGNANRYFKTLITCAEASNEGFKFDWENVNCLKDKKIGIVFREEEFLDLFGQVKTAVKPFRACVYDKTEEQKIPNKKQLVQKQENDMFNMDSITSNNDLPF